MLLTKLYLQELTRFLRTVTIKNKYFADQMRLTGVTSQFRDVLPEELNPYYRHLNGEYILNDLTPLRRLPGMAEADESALEDKANQYGLSLYTSFGGRTYHNGSIYKKFDKLVLVHSLDTKEIIPYTKQNLDLHLRTASVYKIPNTYYYNVVAKYPEEADIIKSITYPITSIQDAISAQNLSILGYDQTLLETNEWVTMFSAMNETLNVIRHRWDVGEFVYEDMYAVAHQAIVWNILLLTLIKQRVVNIKTSSVHSFHIWEYLKSHGLGDYRYVLSKEQQLFLYRNIDYILKNKGTSHNFILLIYKLLNEWNIGIYGKNLQQQVIGQDRAGVMRDARDTAKLLPNICSIQVGADNIKQLRHINKAYDKYLCKTDIFEDELKALDLSTLQMSMVQNGTIENIDTLFEKEKLAQIEYQDPALYERSTADHEKIITNTPHTGLPSKIMEIKQTITSTLLSQIYTKYVTEALFYYIAELDFNPNISFVTAENDIALDLTLKEAIALILYCIMREKGYLPNSMIQFYTEEGILDKSPMEISDGETVEANIPHDKRDQPIIVNDGPVVVDVTWPFLPYFPSIPPTYTWNNVKGRYENIFKIIPQEITLDTNNSLPASAYQYPYTFKRTDSIKTWTWSNGYYTLRYGSVGWVLVANADAYSIYTSDVAEPYSGWRAWSVYWTTPSNTRTRLTFRVSKYKYVIDEQMIPSKITFDTANKSLHLSTVETIHSQADFLVRLYVELHRDASARLREAVASVLSKRMYSGKLVVDLLDGKSYSEFFESSLMIKNLIRATENVSSSGNGATDTVADAYGKLGMALLESVYSYDSPYLLESTGAIKHKYEQLKKLVISLCSYNITFVGSVLEQGPSLIALPSITTFDVIKLQHRSFTVFDFNDLEIQPAWKHTYIRNNVTHSVIKPGLFYSCKCSYSTDLNITAHL